MQDTSKMYFMLSMPVNSIPQPVVMPQFYKSKDFVYNKNYIFIGTAFGQMPLLTDTYAAWYAMNSAQLQNQYNVLASTRNYVARSGAANTDLARLARESGYNKLEEENIASAYGLNSSQGIGFGGVNLTSMAGALSRATKSVTNGNVGKFLNNNLMGIIADVGDYVLGAADDVTQTLSLASLKQAKLDYESSILQSGLSKIRESYDNTQAQLAIQGLQAKITDAQTMSPSVRGMGNSNISAALTNKGITLMLCCITDDYAKRIDNYLSVYGYKVNRFGTINTKSRQNWNYVKTVGANILNNGVTTKLPHFARITIRNIYDNGITFWHGGLSMVYRYGTFDNPEV
jgi:hypothetical protein